MPKIVLIALVIYLPWIIFATFYYGSPVPNTIVAKSSNFHVTVSWMADYLPAYIMSYAPIYEWWFWVVSGDKDIYLKIICTAGVLIEIVLLIWGTICEASRNKKLILIAIVFGVFFWYNLLFVHNTYYMWYLPPFTALAAILVGAGLNNTNFRVKVSAGLHSISFRFKPTANIILCALLIGLYIFPLPSLFSIEKQHQEFIEDGVRKKVGERLALLMSDDDTVVLEPLGYIGYYARNRTIYDFPGLGSKIAVQSLAKPKSSSVGGFLSALIYDLKPTFACLRPGEYDYVRQRISDFDVNYHLIETIESPLTKLHSGFLTLNYNGDSCFMIFQRK